MKDLSALMKQASAMQANLQKAQARLAETTVHGQSGSGLVKVQLKGQGEMVGLEIDPSLIDPSDPETLTDLILAAHADAKRQLDAVQQSLMREAAGPLGGALPPGMGF